MLPHVIGPATEIGGEMTSNPDHPQAGLHRLDRDPQIADGAARRYGEETLAATRRSSSLYRFKTDAEAVKMASDAPTLPSPAREGGFGRGPQSYGLELRSGLPVSRSTGTETCSWMMSQRPCAFL